MISVRNLTKDYRTGNVTLRALDKVSLEVKKGEFVAIMGQSGSGKTTLLNIIGCLDKPSSGSYEFEGKSMEKAGMDYLARIRSKKIGFIFQNYNLLPRLTTIDNVMLGLVYAGVILNRRTRAANALSQMGLAERALHRPSELSGGQQQRVAIARALVKEPDLILADEPTGNIDSKTSAEIMELLKCIHKSGVTIVLITHNPDVARCAGRIVYIRDGRIVDSL